ncbi:GNAT family N-acetyltransferase [Nibrella saemangeumensis]|uniref:GNAT family N-acetyltransferase n=1 Tax=Nibrella saemangeumensis TaxID=1084526 RepID=A0ABP8N8E1_9BACT
MIIRQAEPADAERLTGLAIDTMREAFGPPHNPAELVDAYIRQTYSVPVMQQELADSRSTYLLMETPAGEDIGYARLYRHAPPRRMRERRALEIQRIYLREAYLGQGLGRQLMNHCLAQARAEGYKAVWLGVWERNERGLAFYRKIGFEPFGWHYFQFGTERQRDYWLQKPL